MNDITIVGYVEIDGVRTFSDDTLRAVWMQLAADGTTYLFNKNEVSSRDEFIKFMKHENIHPAIAMVGKEIGGFGWLKNIEGNHAEANHIMFKKFWGKRTIEMAIALTKYWFQFKNELGKDLFDVLVGYTPRANEKACKFVDRIGWTALGIVPFLDEGNDMLISYAIRGEENG